MTTWNVYVYPGTKTSKDYTRRNPSFFRRADFHKAVKIASEAVSKHADWKLKVVSRKSKARIKIMSHNPDTWSPMYLGNLAHAAGLWDQDSRTVVIHDGYIPERTTNKGYSFWWNFTGGSIKRLASLILHEIGHSDDLIGSSHKMNLSHLMRNKPPKDLLLLVQDEFGPPKIDPKHNRDLPADVNDDGVVTPLDALHIIRKLNSGEDPKEDDLYYDVNKDKKITVADALAVINHINRNR